MQDLPVAYWIDNTLYINGSVLDGLFQYTGDLSFLLMLISAQIFALLGVLLWLVFTVRGNRF